MRPLPAAIASKLYGAELIAERGSAEAKMADIAEASGHPSGKLYYYFAGKDDIAYPARRPFSLLSRVRVPRLAGA